MAGDESAAHGDVLLGANLGVVIGPAFPGIVQETDPKQVVFWSIVDQQMGVAIALWGDDGDRRVELQDGHNELSNRVRQSACFENVAAAKRFRREVAL
ncbi:MAG TPA: hypothetical protein VII39_12235, partial [Bradyrhizobium sp.]